MDVRQIKYKTVHYARTCNAFTPQPFVLLSTVITQNTDFFESLRRHWTNMSLYCAKLFLNSIGSFSSPCAFSCTSCIFPLPSELPVRLLLPLQDGSNYTPCCTRSTPTTRLLSEGIFITVVSFSISTVKYFCSHHLVTQGYAEACLPALPTARQREVFPTGRLLFFSWANQTAATCFVFVGVL